MVVKNTIIGWFKDRKGAGYTSWAVVAMYFCRMIGIVLSGGKSSRMGTDKGMLQNAGTAWAKLASDKLSVFLPEIYISVREAQVAHYNGIFDSNKFIVDDVSIGISGPLLALLSVHKKFPSDAVFVFACDMICMETAPIQFLIEHQKKQPFKQCWLFVDDNGVQPLFAIYSAGMLQKVYADLQKGLLKNFSVKHIIDTSDSCLLTVPAEWSNCFRNFNSSEDLATLAK